MLSKKIRNLIFCTTMSILSLIQVSATIVYAKPINQKYTVEHAADYKITRKYIIENKSVTPAFDVEIDLYLGDQIDESPYTVNLSPYKIDLGTPQINPFQQGEVKKETVSFYNEGLAQKCRIYIPYLAAKEKREIYVYRNITTGRLKYNVHENLITNNYSDYEYF